MDIVYVATTATDPGVMSAGITDFEVLDSGGGLTLYSATGPDGGLAAYRIGSGGSLTELILNPYPSGSLLPTSTRLLAVDLPSGGEGLVALGRQGATFEALKVSSTGAFLSSRVDMTPSLGLAGTPGLGATVGSHVALASAGDAVLRSYATGSDGLLIQKDAVDVLADTGLNRGGGIGAVAGVQSGGNDFILVGVSGADQVLSYRVGADGSLGLVNQIGLTTGLGIADPTAIETVTQDGTTYAVIAAAGTSSLTVAKIGSDGSLTEVDHALDSLSTRFEHVTSLSATEADGHAFVLTGGADDGLSLFTLAPGGRLIHLGAIEDSDDRALQNVMAVDMAAVDGTLALFAASETEPGIARLKVTTADLASVVQGAAGTVTVAGGDADDILIAGDGNNSLRGNAGADLFVFCPGGALSDGQLGTVLDYQRGVDRLDLSSLPLFHGVAQLDVAQQSWGARLSYGDWWLDVHSADGEALAASDFTDADVVNLDRVYLGNAGGDAVVLSDSATGGGTGGTGTPPTDPSAGTGGPDLLSGGDAGEALAGMGGNDTLLGGAGDDTLDGGVGADDLQGGDGIDWASYASANAGLTADFLIRSNNTGDATGDLYTSIEALMGSAFDDALLGSNSDNMIDGGAGHDLLKGRRGDDVLIGGIGDDTLDGGGGADDLQGGDGVDIASYATASEGVIVDIAQPRANTGDAAGDSYSSIEGVLGSLHADTLLGRDLSEWFGGGDGDDWILGRGGADTLEGGTGNDTLEGGPGADFLNGGGGQSDVASYFEAASGVSINLADPGRNTGEAAGDSYAGIEVVLGSTYGDDLRGSGGGDTLVGRSGDDFLMGLADRDMLRGDDGNDTLDGGDGSDTLRGGAGHDVLYGGQGNDRILGEAGNDRIVATLGNNKLFGGTGADTVMDGPGASRLTGNAGSDFLIGGAGNDTLVGGSAHDTLAGGDGRDKIVGGTGNDFMVGNAGNDWFVFNPGYGTDTIGDFSLAEGDQLYISRTLAGGADAAGVLALGHDSAQGLLFAFDDGTSVLLAGVHSTSGLESQIVVFG